MTSSGLAASTHYFMTRDAWRHNPFVNAEIFKNEAKKTGSVGGSCRSRKSALVQDKPLSIDA